MSVYLPEPQTTILAPQTTIPEPQTTIPEPQEELYKYALSVLGLESITSSNIISITNSLLQITNTYKLSGSQKKQLVLDTITNIVKIQ